jgi:hypothetical protein
MGRFDSLRFRRARQVAGLEHLTLAELFQVVSSK